MTLVSSEVRVAGTGEVYIAAPHTALPVFAAAADILGTLTGFTGLGYSREDGVTLSKTVNREGLPAWQSLTPLRFVFTGIELSASSIFMQSNADTVKAWLGGSDFTEIGTSSVFKSDLGTTPSAQEHALAIRWIDEAIGSILYIPKIEIGETGDITLQRSQDVGFQVAFDAVAPDSGVIQASWYTNDPAFDPA